MIGSLARIAARDITGALFLRPVQVKQTPKTEQVAPDVLKPSRWARLFGVLLSLFNSPKR